MRKTLGLLCAAAMLLPIGVITANAAGGAAATPTCGATKGTAKFTPALPKITNPPSKAKKVLSKLTATGTLSGCAGGGVTGGSVKFTQTSKPTPGNCSTLAAPSKTSKGTIGTLVITWAGGKGTSTATAFTVKQTAAIVDATTTGKITSGLFAGKTITGTTTYTLPKGACSTADLSTLSYTNKKGTKFVIK